MVGRIWGGLTAVGKIKGNGKIFRVFTLVGKIWGGLTPVGKI